MRPAICSASSRLGDVLADHDELVAAEAGDLVAGAHAALEPAGDEEQQLVAGLVAAACRSPA